MYERFDVVNCRNPGLPNRSAVNVENLKVRTTLIFDFLADRMDSCIDCLDEVCCIVTVRITRLDVANGNLLLIRTRDIYRSAIDAGDSTLCYDIFPWTGLRRLSAVFSGDTVRNERYTYQLSGQSHPKASQTYRWWKQCRHNAVRE